MIPRTLRTFLFAATLVCGVCVVPPSVALFAADEQPESAGDVKAKITAAIEQGTARSLNEALRLLKVLDGQCKEPSEREAVGFDELVARTLKVRDAFFRKAVRPAVLESMAMLIVAKVREKKPSPPAAGRPAPVPNPGTLAAARAWAMKEMRNLIWDCVRANLGLTAEEMDAYWKDRTELSVLTVSYGAGTFLVLADGGRIERHKDPNKPKPGEEWWDEVGPVERARWLTAWFVESSGLFDVVRADTSEACGGCGGRGVLVANNDDGTQKSVVCPTCNGASKVRKVGYR